MAEKRKMLSRYVQRKLSKQEAEADLELFCSSIQQMTEQNEEERMSFLDLHSVIITNTDERNQAINPSVANLQPTGPLSYIVDDIINEGDAMPSIPEAGFEDDDECYSSDADDEQQEDSLNNCDPSVYLPLLSAAFQLKNHITKKAFGQHVKIVEIAQNSNNRSSVKLCFEKYDILKTKLKKIYVCSEKKCDSILAVHPNDGSPLKKQPCGHNYSKLNGSCYALVLPIRPQLKYFLENGGMIQEKKRASMDGTKRGDIQSGDGYRESMYKIPANQTAITLQLNVDGAQCFKSSRYGFWPFMAVINEAPYQTRRSNMILMSLWYGNKKPPRNVLLDSSISELESLGQDGIFHCNMNYLVRPLILTTDTMARAVFLNCMQCNGLCGCDFCLHPGEQIRKGRGSARVYPEPVNNPTHPPRTMEQHHRDLKVVESTGSVINGIKGPSPLAGLTDFDYVRAQVPDYLHSICQGVIKFFLELWTQPKNHKEPWYLNGKKREVLDSRLKQVKPAYLVTRTSRTLSEISLWKASEFRSFALYYFPLLEDLLPKPFFGHFLKLVYGLQVLLQDEVAVEKVKDVGILLQQFVRESGYLYGEKNMRFNLHLVTHLANSVLDWGCLWSTSTFIPEWFNGELVSMANGTQAVAEQMVHSFMKRNVIRSEAMNLISTYTLPKSVTTLFRDLLNIPYGLDSTISPTDGVVTISDCGVKMLGRSVKKETCLDTEIAMQNWFQQANRSNKESLGLQQEIKYYYFYQRITIEKKGTFTTTLYTRSPKRINYCALMSDGHFIFIDNILHYPSLPNHSPKLFIIGRRLGTVLIKQYSPPEIGCLSFCDLPGQTTKLVGLSKENVAYNANDIQKKCVLAFNNLLTETFIVTAMPNSVETD